MTSKPFRASAAQTPSSGRVVRAFAPGSIGNIGPGLDILGCAVTGAGDVVEAVAVDASGVRIDEPGHPDLPFDPQRHASAIAATEVLRRAGATAMGVALRIEKGLPLSGGQGGSAASSIAAALAVNTLLGGPLTDTEVLLSALVAEERVAGRHIDNLAPALYGGIVLIRSIDPPEVVRLPVPEGLRIVLLHPNMRLRTADARSVLPAMVNLPTAISQAVAVASMVSALWAGDLSQLRGAIDDQIAEPARAHLLPGFVDAKRAAIEAGALGCSIAGGGPSSFAMVDGDDDARRVLGAMEAAYRAAGMSATGRIARIDEVGARIESSSSTTP